MLGMRSSPNALTLESPFFLQFSRDIRLPFETAVEPRRPCYDFTNNFPEEILLKRSISKRFAKGRELPLLVGQYSITELVLLYDAK